MSRGEAKDSALLSSRDVGLLEPPERRQGSPASSIHEILQERMLKWVAMPFSGDLPNPGTQTVKKLPAVQETQVRSLSQEDPLEKEVATDSSILA